MKGASDFRMAMVLARRELRGGLKGLRVFLACLALGVAAIAGVGSLSASLSDGLKSDARGLLGGDVEIEQNHDGLTPEQDRWLAARAERTRTVEMRSMASRTDDSRRSLVELKAVDGHYPLYGALRLDSALPRLGPDVPRLGLGDAAAEGEAMDRLGLKVGQSFRLGNATFRLAARILHEPDRGVSLFNLAPRVMIAAAALPQTGLMQPGSMVRVHYKLRLAPGSDPAAFGRALKAAFPEADWRIRGLDEAAPGAQTFVERTSLFLTLVGLTALLVGGIGVGNGARAYLEGRTATIAILKALGATRPLVLKAYLVQILGLSLIGIAAGLTVGALVPSLAVTLAGTLMPISARPGLFPLPLTLAAAYGLLTALAFTLPALARAREVPPARLLRDVVQHDAAPLPKGALAVSAAALLGLGGLAVATAPGGVLAGAFLGGIAVTFGAFRGAAWLLQRLARRAARRRAPGLRLALANLGRPGSPAAGIVASLGIGLTVLAMVAQVEGNLSREILQRLPGTAPAFFLIDLQPDQLSAFDALVRSLPAIRHMARAPAVSGRVVALNGVPIERAHVAPDAQWLVRSDRNLTYAAEPPEGTRLVAGQWWPASYRGAPLVSLTADLAQGCGLKVGDSLTVRVVGREMTATIANLREADWGSMRLNFAIVFAPGSLEGAPQSTIATLYAGPEAEESVERAVTSRFPNVTAIRVREALAAADHILSGLGLAIRGTALLTLLAGALVLAGALAAGQARRQRDAVLLKVLGAERRMVLGAFLLEFAILGLAAAILALLFGSVAAWLVVSYVLKQPWVFLPGNVTAVLALSLAVTVILGLAGTWRALSLPPAVLLRAR